MPSPRSSPSAAWLAPVSSCSSRGTVCTFYLSSQLSICRSIHPSIDLSIHLSIYLSISRTPPARGRPGARRGLRRDQERHVLHGGSDRRVALCASLSRFVRLPLAGAAVGAYMRCARVWRIQLDSLVCVTRHGVMCGCFGEHVCARGGAVFTFTAVDFSVDLHLPLNRGGKSRLRLNRPRLPLHPPQTS